MAVGGAHYNGVEKREANEEANEEANPVLFKLKLKAVKAEGSELHPKSTIASKSTHKLKYRAQLERWKKQIQTGGSKNDKYRTIDSWVYDRFCESRNNGHLVTTRMLRQWAMAAAGQLESENFNFKASKTWTDEFKARYRISQRHVTKYVSYKEKQSFEEILENARLFQIQTAAIVPQFNPDFEINTDQSGCEYRISSKRTLSHKGEKVTEIAVSQLNHLTHSYTVQYGLTLSGNLLPHVFICLQEVNGKFGPRVQQEVTDLMARHPNVYITATKSGKLTKVTYDLFLDNVLKPYVQTEPFLFIVDSWGRQSDPSLYDMKFRDENETPTCTSKIIPPKCTPLCQPCDVYFYRQVKNFIRRLQNSPAIIEQNRDITARKDAIKIHALIHNQLQAPAYRKMIGYAWCAAKLTPDREIFSNVNDISFPDNTHTEKCDCRKGAFARCSWCFKFVCFECFYDNFHPNKCDKVL